MDTSQKKILQLFGANLAKARHKKGLSVRELASKCKVGPSRITQLELGKANLTLTTLIELANGLGIPPKKLLDFKIDSE